MSFPKRPPLEIPDRSLASGGVERELFEACRNGDIVKVRRLISAQNVNAR